MTALADSTPEHLARRRKADRPRATFWAAMAAPGTIWLLALFVVPAYAILAVAFGGIDPILRTASRRGTRPIGTSRRCATSSIACSRGDLAHVFVRTGLYALAALIGCFAIGYPGRVLRRPGGGPLARRPARAARVAVLDQLPDAHAGVGQPAADRRLRQPRDRVLAPRRRHTQLARRRLADRGDGTDLRLRAVLHPSAVRRPGAARLPAVRGRPATSAHRRSGRS